MLREEAINKWIIPSIKNTWNAKKCKEILEALEQEPCEDCVSRQFMYELGATCIATRDENGKLIALGAIEELPSVTSQERKGHWVKTPKAVMGEGYMWYCDKCEHQVYQDSSRDYPSEKYCPNCGSDNREVEK